jgi:nicotinamidase-related amidase
MKTHNTIAVIIIDMQDFFLQHFKESVCRTLISNQLKVLDLCAKKHIPLIVTEYKARGKFRGSTTHILNKKIKTISHVLIIKEKNSAFTKTNLDEVLKKLKIKKLFIMGINANACVQDTAISAIHKKYKVFTAKGITASASRTDLEFSQKNEGWYRNNCILLNSPEEALMEIGKHCY